jgi:hypothetical protein
MKPTWSAAIVVLLSAALAIAAPTCAAEYVPQWSKIFVANEFDGYLDLKSKSDGPVQQDRPVTKEMVALVNFKNPRSGAAKPILSMTERVRFDCMKHQSVGIYHTYHDAGMGVGIELGTASDSFDWTTPKSGTFDEMLWNAVCGAPRLPGETDEQVALATARNNADIGNSCGEPETGNSAIVAYLNSKVGQFGGPAQRVRAIKGAPPQANDTSDRHTRCHGTLIFAGGTTEVGLLLQDRVNGVISWRWHSDVELAQGSNSPAQKKIAAQIDDDMRRSATAKPDEMVGCGVEGPETVYTTRAVCYAVMKLVKDNQGKLRPYAGYALLQNCGRISSGVCLGIVSEMQLLVGTAQHQSKSDLTQTCANDLGRKFPGNEPPQYMNSCRDLVGYFK